MLNVPIGSMGPVCLPKQMVDFCGQLVGKYTSFMDPTWRMIPVSKWLGSPPFISHGVRSFGKGPTTRSLGEPILPSMG